MSNKYYRSLDDVIYGRNGEVSIFLYAGLCPDLDVKRNFAITEVLGRIPEKDYKKLLEKADEFCWFVPDEDQLAMCQPFPVTHPRERAENGLVQGARAEVIYLSPKLEGKKLDIVIAVIAHELAHIYAGHKTICPPDVYEIQEKEAWQLVQKWGFDEEYKVYKKYREKEAIGSQ